MLRQCARSPESAQGHCVVGLEPAIVSTTGCWGVGFEPDLDHLIGTWTTEEAAEVNRALEDFSAIDEEMWK